MTVDVGAGDCGCSTDVCAGLGATEAKAVPGRDARREDDRDCELSRGDAEVTRKERPKKPLLTVNFWTTVDSAADFLSANVVPTAEAAETALETVAILNPLHFTTAQPFHEEFVTARALPDPALLLQPRADLLLLDLSQ